MTARQPPLEELAHRTDCWGPEARIEEVGWDSSPPLAVAEEVLRTCNQDPFHYGPMVKGYSLCGRSSWGKYPLRPSGHSCLATIPDCSTLLRRYDRRVPFSGRAGLGRCSGRVQRRVRFRCAVAAAGCGVVKVLVFACTMAARCLM